MFFTCFSRTHRSGRSAERGSALVGVLLLLLMMTALASALAVSGHTETLVARNHQSAAQARAAAEAGLNHATEVVLSWILAWKTNGYADVAAALDDLLLQLDANPDFLTGVTFGDGADPTAIDGAADGEYHVFLMDEDDDTLRGEDSTDLTTDGDASNDEDGNALTDNNRAVVIQATGYAGRLRPGANKATAQLEGIISPYRFSAIAADGDLNLSGNVSINVSGDAIGGAHANGDLIVSGNTEIIGDPAEKGTATATGECEDCADVATNPDASGGSKSPLDIPEIRASDYLSWADYILHDDGILEDVGGATVDCSGGGNPCKAQGWRFTSKSAEWELIDRAGTMATGTMYVEGPVDISSGTALNPVVATIIAEGSITGGGNNHIVPAAGDLLFVTDVDLVLSGGFNAGAAGNEGQMLVHEQIAISGNAVVYGQIVVQNATTTETPDTSRVSGNVDINNSQDVGSSMFHVSGWREVR